MNKYKGQLHVHSVLSPCASLEMGPRSILQKAKEFELDFIAITDHNSTKNLRAFKDLQVEFGIKIIYGIEIETKEEVHILCLFDNLTCAEQIGELVYQSLLPIPNNPDIFGDQVIVDFAENIIDFEDRLLLQRSHYSIDKIYDLVETLGGLAIPAHIDRQKNGLLPTLGFIEEDNKYKIFEVSKTCDLKKLYKEYNLSDQFIYKGCDAHHLDEIGHLPLFFEVNELNIDEIKKAFYGDGKRKYHQGQDQGKDKEQTKNKSNKSKEE